MDIPSTRPATVDHPSSAFRPTINWLCAGFLCACIAAPEASFAAPGSDESRVATMQSIVMLASRVVEGEQEVIARKDACARDPSLSAAFAAWQRRNGSLYAKAHRLLDPAFVRGLLGDRLAKSPGGAGFLAALPQMESRAYEGWKAAAKSTDCGAFSRRLAAGEFDYARQSPQAFRVVQRIDIGKAGQYTLESLIELGR